MSEAFQEKAKRGPVAFMTVLPPGHPLMRGRQLVQWFAYCLQSWPATARSVFDGLVYGLVTGGAFGWLWP